MTGPVTGTPETTLPEIDDVDLSQIQDLLGQFRASNLNATLDRHGIDSSVTYTGDNRYSYEHSDGTVETDLTFEEVQMKVFRDVIAAIIDNLPPIDSLPPIDDVEPLPPSP